MRIFMNSWCKSDEWRGDRFCSAEYRSIIWNPSNTPLSSEGGRLHQPPGHEHLRDRVDESARILPRVYDKWVKS
jgi:hypothetical protein